MADEKKYLNEKVPFGVDMYFPEMARLTVLSCMHILLATSRSVSGFKCTIPLVRNPFC